MMLKRRRTPDRNSQSGAVLICALAMVAAMSLAAVSVLDGISLSVRTSLHLESSQRARYYVDAAILAAQSKLEEALIANTLSTLLLQAEDTSISLPFADGVMQVELKDGNNCFNLNALAADDEQSFEQASDILTQLLEEFGLSTGEANERVAAIADWIDEDSRARYGGAEDLHYTGLAKPYRTAGQPLADVSELRRIDGFEAKLLESVSDLFCVRPDTVLSPLNVNLLEVEQAPLLAAYTGSGLSVGAAKSIIQQRPANGYSQVRDFLAYAEQTYGFALGQERESLFSVESALIRLNILVLVQESELAATADLSIDSKTTQEISRKFGA